MSKSEKSYDSKMKGESSKSFQRFLIYRNLPPEKRTLKKVMEELCHQKSPDSVKDNKVTINSLKKNSERWFWVERAELYDHNKLLQEIQENESEFKKVSKDFKKLFKKILNFSDELLTRIIDNENDYALSTQIKMLQDMMNTLSKAHEQFRLASGRSTTNNTNYHTGELEVNNKIVGEENIFEHTDEELERILTINDEFNEKFVDEL